MTIGIIPESDRKGRAVCQSWLPGGKHNVTPTDRISVRRESPWGLPDPPPFFGKEGDLEVPQKKQSKYRSIKNANLARRWRS